MRLSHLLTGIEYLDIVGPTDIEITGLTTDSRSIKQGDLFVCLKGNHYNGHDFIPQAIINGASAIICEHTSFNFNFPENIACIKVASTEKVLAPLGAFFYDFPARKLQIYGVVGTNGKTTSTYLLKSILERAGYKVGLIGTIKYIIGNEEIPAKNTTPNALELQQLMSRMVSQGITHLVMEVSSHAIKLGRIEQCQFAGGIFTNITQDHLDFHKTFEEYLAVKASFFAALPRNSWAAINLDDPHAEDFMAKTSANIVTYSKEKHADICAVNARVKPDGISYFLSTREGNGTKINLHLTGEFNISNSLGVAALAYHAEKIPLTVIKKGLQDIYGVNGRVERVRVDTDFSILVDYAHTPDALENVLRTLRGFTPRRLIVLFGCGGDRDKTKRPLMGKIAARYADFVIVTSDNPRSENPESIIKDIVAGINEEQFTNYQTITDRYEAIFAAVSMAKKGDVIVIAGKGHETYQIFADKTIYFDDREVAIEAVKELKKNDKMVGA